MGVPSPVITSVVHSPLRHGSPTQCTPTEPTEEVCISEAGEFLLPVAMIDKELDSEAANPAPSTVAEDDDLPESENIPTSDSAGQDGGGAELELKDSSGMEESMLDKLEDSTLYMSTAQSSYSAASCADPQMWSGWEDCTYVDGWGHYYQGQQMVYDNYGNPIVCAVYAVPMVAEAGDESATEQQPPRPHPRKAKQPPPIPQHEGAYRPRWVYGCSWPFNTAPTTLIAESLPVELTQSRLLEVLDDWGFCGYYDFVFLPVNLRTGRSQQHAIINVTRHSVGLALADRLHGFCEWGTGDGHKRCQVTWSLPTQGLAELVENHRNHPAMHEAVEGSLRPVLFSDGWQVPFPPPTRWLRNPFQVGTSWNRKAMRSGAAE
mmetsp:Transcript_66136/g.123404  ORF Transcript_66136/g.123404 Transcript_66136/m.123404 type:complete len:376 (-) Transcript_66136:157-1284(-)